jgi:hypothetical protein
MAHADLEKARECHEKIRDLIVRHPGGWQDDASLLTLRGLCRAAAAAADDRECATPLASIERYAVDLFSASGHDKWARKSTSGPVFLRLQILRELEWFRARLFVLGAARAATARKPVFRRYE